MAVVPDINWNHPKGTTHLCILLMSKINVVDAVDVCLGKEPKVQRKEHLGPMMVKMRYDKQNELELMGLYFDAGRPSDKQIITQRTPGEERNA